jgi:Raf kinase inhibitor-like YbhB/YbcL family protein
MRKCLWVLGVCFFVAMPVFAMELKSSDFQEGHALSRDWTCMGRNQSPALSWQGAPEKTVSFALICEDPDAPAGTWTHWIVFNLPPTVHGLPGGVSSEGTLFGSGQQGMNDFQKIGYGGPCPPMGQSHRYQFKLYALDAMLPLTGLVTRDKFLVAIEGHVLAEADLTGVFRR